MLTPDVIQLFCEKILKAPITLTYYELNELLFPNRRYRVVGWYGKGENGVILQVESLENNAIYALKVIDTRRFPNDQIAMQEFVIQKEFARYNMAPQIYFMDVYRTRVKDRAVQFARVLMDPIHCTLLQLIREQTPADQKKTIKAFLCLVRKKYLLEYPRPFLHSDMHFNNIVLLKDKKTLGFIDFGLTRPKPALLQILDCIPLVTSLKMVSATYSGPRRDACLNFARDVIRLYNKFFRVQLNWDAFQTQESGAYHYVADDGMTLHSYDWVPDPKLQRTLLPTEEDIRRVFPSIQPPNVRE